MCVKEPLITTLQKIKRKKRIIHKNVINSQQNEWFS